MRLFYGGSVQPQRGMKQVIQSAIMAAKKKPETMFQLHLVCNLPAEDGLFLNKLLADSIPANLKLYYAEFMPFTNFCRYVSKMDLCFDLRTISWEHSHSLPIKLFYYLACGRPVVYSRLKSVTAFFPAISFGHVVNPSDIERIATIITHYIDHADNYTKHCQEALNLSVEKYNWDKIKGDFIQFIQKISKNGGKC
jgi:glycosyltransferase involved in cell wall biosynthesis